MDSDLMFLGRYNKCPSQLCAMLSVDVYSVRRLSMAPAAPPTMTRCCPAARSWRRRGAAPGHAAECRPRARGARPEGHAAPRPCRWQATPTLPRVNGHPVRHSTSDDWSSSERARRGVRNAWVGLSMDLVCGGSRPSCKSIGDTPPRVRL